MALIVRRRPIFALQIIGIDWRIFEGNLIVVRIIESLAQRISCIEFTISGKLLTHTEPKRIVFCVHRRLKIGHRVRTAGNRVVVNLPDRTPDDKARAEVVDTVYSYNKPFTNLLFDTEIDLLHHRITEAVVNDVDSSRPCTCKKKSAEWAA